MLVLGLEVLMKSHVGLMMNIRWVILFIPVMVLIMEHLWVHC